jgi:hypothetical protein
MDLGYTTAALPPTVVSLTIEGNIDKNRLVTIVPPYFRVHRHPGPSWLNLHLPSVRASQYPKGPSNG